MSEALVPKDEAAAIMERVLLVGDLAKLTPSDRVLYYTAVCESVGLNPFTRPFDYIVLSGKLTLYAKRDATEQLRKIHGVSILELVKEMYDGIYVVTARARDRDGREDIGTGAVPLGELKGEMRANAIMKCETKAKRRVTLSICGLGFLDETEVSSVPDAKVVSVDQAHAGSMYQYKRPTTPLPPHILEKLDKETGERAPVAPPTGPVMDAASWDTAAMPNPTDPFQAMMRMTADPTEPPAELSEETKALIDQPFGEPGEEQENYDRNHKRALLLKNVQNWAAKKLTRSTWPAFRDQFTKGVPIDDPRLDLVILSDLLVALKKHPGAQTES
jgi:hypothetical protein